MRFFVFAALVAVAFASRMHDVLVTRELADSINQANTTWTASPEQGAFFKGATRAQIMRLMGVRKNPNGPRLPLRSYPKVDVSALPTNFDAAVQWPTCSTINQIRDQSACGSCWAFGAAEAISDRYCTYATKPQNLSISANDLVACCDIFHGCGMGCSGGDPAGAWAYWVSTGLVDDACDPYPFPKCEHHISGGKYPPCPANEYPTPSCATQCKNGATWSGSLHKGTNSWSLTGESSFMQELYAHGPFEVAFTVYEDFLTYKSGVYTHTKGSALGGHAVKVTGWGVLNNVPYWKIANSWNEDWGNQGFFLIKRGSDECGIEDEGSAGQP
jgi:hypothetical protein